MAQDCFFYVDMEQDVPDEEKCISVLCVKCRKEKYPDAGWFWAGSKLGYGPWPYSCNVCGLDVSQDQDEKVETPIQNS